MFCSRLAVVFASRMKNWALTLPMSKVADIVSWITSNFFFHPPYPLFFKQTMTINLGGSELTRRYWRTNCFIQLNTTSARRQRRWNGIHDMSHVKWKIEITWLHGCCWWRCGCLVISSINKSHLKICC